MASNNSLNNVQGNFQPSHVGVKSCWCEHVRWLFNVLPRLVSF